MTTGRILVTLLYAGLVFTSIPIIAFPEDQDNNCHQLLSQNPASVSKQGYELGTFPNKGSMDDWRRANEIVRDTKNLRKTSNFREAIRKADQALRIYPFDANIYLDRALSYYQLGINSETAGDTTARDKFISLALQDYYMALESSNDWRLHAGLSKAYVHQNRIPEAAKAAHNAIFTSHPSPPVEQRDKLMLLLEELNKRFNKQSEEHAE